ncbi:MAG: ATP-binding protein [Spirochaetota bacterium]
MKRNLLASSLQFKLSLYFAIVGMISILTISLLVNVFLEKQFQEYARREQESRNREILTMLTSQYTGDGFWHVSGIKDVGVYALNQGMIIKISDKNGDPVWDALDYDSGMCTLMKNQISSAMLSRYPNMAGGFSSQSYPILSGNSLVGALAVSSYRPFYFSDNEFLFIETINQTLLWTALGTLLLSLSMGLFISRRLSQPLIEVSTLAKRISEGDYRFNIGITTTTRELNEMIESINQLAHTLQKQDELRKRLSADVAHELRTPLATLQSHMEAMLDGIWEPDVERLSGCHEEILRLTMLVSGLEQLAHIEGDNVIINKAEFDFKEVARKCLLLHEHDFMKKGVALTFGGESTTVIGDEYKIKQVIINLLSNALKYTPSGGRVHVEIKNNGAYAELTITDTGCGIPPEDLPSIFERFYRVDKSRTRTTGGVGIGLTIAREIVRSHGGTILVESSPNEGSVFTVRLPRG